MRRALFAISLLALCWGTPGCKVKELEAELARVNGVLSKTQGELDGEKSANKRLSEENKTYEEKIAELEAEVQQLETQVADLAEKQGITASELAELRAEKAKREKELKVYQDLFAKLKAMVDAGTIEVVFRKGRMTVKLREAILFDSGKAKLRAEGKEAVAQLVPALKTVGDREFLVAGHTDNVPINTARFKSNWELSTARALSMVEEMIADGYPPGRIGAAGFGEWDPVEANDSKEGRSHNRRIEIVLMPNLGEIPGMADMLKGGRGRKS